MKYQERAKSKEWFDFDCTKRIWETYGFFPCQLVDTPKGKAIVIGRYRGDLWFHIHGDSGASYWSTYNSKATFESGGFGEVYHSNFVEAVEKQDVQTVKRILDSGELHYRGREEALFEFVMSFGSNNNKVLAFLCGYLQDISSGVGGPLQSIIGLWTNALRRVPRDQVSDARLLSKMEILLSHGASVNRPDGKMETPLHIAVRQGNYELVKYLVEHSAELNATNDFGETPLHLSARGQNEIYNYLISKGANKTMKNSGFENENMMSEDCDVSLNAPMELSVITSDSSDYNLAAFLPRETLGFIFSFLKSITERQRVSLVCKYWNEVAECNWKTFFLDRWPAYAPDVQDEYVQLDWKEKAFKRLRLEHGILSRSDMLIIHNGLHTGKKVFNMAGKILSPEYIGVSGHLFTPQPVPAKVQKNLKKLGLEEPGKTCTCVVSPTGSSITIVNSTILDDWKEP